MKLITAERQETNEGSSVSAWADSLESGSAGILERQGSPEGSGRSAAADHGEQFAGQNTGEERPEQREL